MKKVNNTLIITILLCYSSLAWPTENYFTCKTSKGILSLNGDANKLVYEINGQHGDNFKYSSQSPAYSGFLYNHYFRFQTNYLNVSFKQNGFKYVIFSNYEDGKSTKGVMVINLKSHKEYIYNCQNEGIDMLVDLIDKLQCDKDNALGC